MDSASQPRRSGRIDASFSKRLECWRQPARPQLLTGRRRPARASQPAQVRGAVSGGILRTAAACTDRVPSDRRARGTWVAERVGGRSMDGLRSVPPRGRAQRGIVYPIIPFAPAGHPRGAARSCDGASARLAAQLLHQSRAVQVAVHRAHGIAGRPRIQSLHRLQRSFSGRCYCFKRSTRS